MNFKTAFGFLMALPLLCLPLGSVCADEGMWLYNRLPTTVLWERHQFRPTEEWLHHLMRSSVRLGGASAEFVSREGLILSNHHVGAGAIQRLSTPERNYMRDGFYASRLSDELPCPGTEARVLLRIEDVTSSVNEAVKAGVPDEEAFELRRAAIAKLEREASSGDTVAEVVTLFQGAEYHLYVYKRYSDVRLVFAPEEAIAAFGGDADNFEYPRYCLDICFFRAYENGKPAVTEHFLQWSQTGVRSNDLVFVSGHPYRTDRLRTVAELEYIRGTEMPRALERLKRTEVLLDAFALNSKEQARRARGDLRSVENGRKARDGMLAGLLDPDLMNRKRSEETKLKEAVSKNADLSAATASWDRIENAQESIEQISSEYELLESGTAFNSSLFSYARRLLRAAEERTKPDEARLEEYRSSALPSMEHSLLSEAPIYPDLETAKLGDSLTAFALAFEPDHPLVKKVLAGKSPQERAGELVAETKLAGVAERKRLYAGGLEAVQASKDPMLDLARMVDAEARALRNKMETRREAMKQAQANIGKVRYAVYGPGHYPDATGSLRLSFGKVIGFEEDGVSVPPWTTIAGLYARAREHELTPPYDLPSNWVSARKRLDLKTPFNFICTADIIGGNSGSPVVNREGHLVGVIFDSNLQGLVADFEYSDKEARAVAVDSRGILESLRKVYRATRLLDELQPKN